MKMNGNNGFNILKYAGVEDTILVYGYLRQQEQELFTDKHKYKSYFNLHSIAQVILRHIASIITLQIKVSSESSLDFQMLFNSNRILWDLKKDIEQNHDYRINSKYNVEHLKFFHNNQELDDDETIESYGIDNCSIITIDPSQTPSTLRSKIPYAKADSMPYRRNCY
eukprot:143842_1